MGAAAACFAGLIFRWFFEYNTGVVNNWLIALGLAPLQWLSSPTLAFWAISIAKASSFMALMLLAGLDTFPKSLYEAAEVDGASTWQRFVEITLPMLQPAIFVALIFARSARCNFDIPFAMTGGGPGVRPRRSRCTSTRRRSIPSTSGHGSALATLML